MSDLIKLTIAQALAGLKSRQFSAVDLTQAYLNKVASSRNLNAYITETPEMALAMAAASDQRIAAGQMGLLEGIPLGIKDLFCTKGVRTTAGSKMLEQFVPPYESTVTSKLFAAGATMLGKLNMDEFAMGSANITSAYGPVKSPWRNALHPEWDLVPGGSSGGSSAAVAAGLALGATGTDTGGSIRQPAAFTGIVGLKPTYGLCSRYGIVGFASSLDQAGPMARTVRDAALMLQAMAGHDPKDSTSINKPLPDYLAAMTGDIRGLRVGIPKEYVVDGMAPEIEKMWHTTAMEWLRSAGAEIHEISLPHTKYALPTYYILAPAEASSNLARYDGVRFGARSSGKTLDELYANTRADTFGQEVKRRILVGTYVLSAGEYESYYCRAQQVRALIKRDFDEAFKKVDVVLTPTAPNDAFALGQEPKDPVLMYLNDVFTVPANLAGLPGISIPAGLSAAGLPLGLQLLGPALSEATLFRAAAVLEAAAQFPDLPLGV